MIYALCILVAILGFGFGIVVCALLQIQKDSDYLQNECHRCGMKALLPRSAIWEYRHDCDSHKCETFIAQMEINAEGKTLC